MKKTKGKEKENISGNRKYQVLVTGNVVKINSYF